jgi:hypothetical protein
MRRYSETEDKFIKKNYLRLTLKEMGKSLGRTHGSVYQRMRYLGLELPIELVNERKSRANKLNVNSGRFKSGHVPANKGKKMPKEVYDKAAPTMFKKGHLPHNTRKDGDISIRTDKTGRKYQVIRTELGKWEHLHRVIWNQQYGEIPKGMLIKFKDGDSMNCNIENLFITDRKGNMIDNTIHRYPPELQKAIRAVNKIEKLTSD